MNTTVKGQEERFCRYQGIMCEYATEYGYCKITGCAKLHELYGSYKGGMTREEAKEALSVLKIYDNQWLREAVDMAIEALKNEPILCEDCRHRNTWDNQRFDPQYYKCGKGVKFRDYGYVREDDYCPLGERREP